MKTVVLGALMAALAAVPAPAAVATHDEIVGGCGYAAVTLPDQYGGLMRVGEMDLVWVSSGPEWVTVSCVLLVNNRVQAYLSGSDVVQPVVYQTSASDVETLCQTVSSSHGTTTDCFETGASELPPPIVGEIVDPVVCAFLPLLGGTSGPGRDIYVDDDGDVYAGGERLFDCPPFGPPSA